MANVADDVHHTFPGDNALGGKRPSAAAVRRWFDREQLLFGITEAAAPPITD